MEDSTEKDYLAVVLVGAGSCWARGKHSLDTMNNCVKQLISDWGSTYRLHGHKVTITLFDVTGNNKVRWDVNGVHGDNDACPITKIGEFDTVLVHRPRKKR